MADTSPKQSIFAGDSSSWVSSFNDYSAAEYEGIITFQKHGFDPVKLIATASGTDFSFTFPAEKSALMQPGKWNWAIRVTKTTTSKTVLIGTIVIRPNPERVHEETFYEKCLKLVKDAIENRLIDVQESISILGQDITKVPINELHTLQHYYQAQVNKERKFTEQLITGRKTRRSRIYLKD